MNPSPSLRKRAFTLTEAVVAMFVATFVLGAAGYFIVEGTRSSLRTTSSIENDLVQWSISSRLQIDSKTADGVVIYPTMDESNIKISSRCRNSTDSGTRSRGNFLVLTRSSMEDGSRDTFYDKITGYAFDPDAKTLSMFEFEVPEASRNLDLETIVKSAVSSVDLQIVATEVEALDAKGPFVCRDLADRNVNAAAATFKVNRGQAKVHTADSILVDISFRIRG